MSIQCINVGAWQGTTMHVHVRRKKLMIKVFINFSGSIHNQCYRHTTCVKVYKKGHETVLMTPITACADSKNWPRHEIIMGLWTLLKAKKKLHTFKILEMYHFQPALTVSSNLELGLISLKWFHKLIKHIPLKYWKSMLLLSKSQCTECCTCKITDPMFLYVMVHS